MLNPTHFCPKCGEWWFAVLYPTVVDGRRGHDLWRVYPVNPNSAEAPLRMLLCPDDGNSLVPWLIDFDSLAQERA